MPFLDSMAVVFILLLVIMVVITLLDPKTKNAQRIIEVDKTLFRCSPSFVVGSVLILGILTALYTAFW